MILPSELPSIEITQLQVAPSSVSQHSGSSQATLDQNGTAIHIPSPSTSEDPQVAPSLASGSDTGEEEDTAVATSLPSNSVRFADLLQRDLAQSSEPTDIETQIAMPIPEPAPIGASAGSQLRVNWGFESSSRPSERIPRQIIPVAAQSVMRYDRKVRM